MLIDKLKEWKYYERKLPLYMRNSYGITEHFVILYELLLQLDKLEDEVMYALNVFDTNYLDFINSLDTSINKDKSDILDKLATLYGLTRDFDVTYEENNVVVSASLHLNNSELLKLIKARIIQNDYKGTYEESRYLYEKIGFPIYMLQTGEPAYAYLFLDVGQYTPTLNERILFLAGFFTLKSMGIRYATAIGQVVELAIYDSFINSRTWDNGHWS